MADTDAISPAAAIALNAMARQLSFLAAEGVTLADVITHAIPRYSCPTPKCPHCNTLWRVRSSRRVSAHLYKRTMECECKVRPVILVGAEFVRPRRSKKAL